MSMATKYLCSIDFRMFVEKIEWFKFLVLMQEPKWSMRICSGVVTNRCILKVVNVVFDNLDEAHQDLFLDSCFLPLVHVPAYPTLHLHLHHRMQSNIPSTITLVQTLQGKRIHGSAPGFLAQKFKAFNHLEGRVYGITNWDLEEDKNAFKLTESSHKFLFDQETNMYEIVEDNYPRFLFNFKNFNELFDPQKIDSNKLFGAADTWLGTRFLGTKVQGAVDTWLGTRFFLAQKFKEFNILEGRVYGIINWDLEEDKNAFKLTESSHKFLFGQETNMYKIIEDNYLRFMFNFKNFNELSDPQTVDSNKLFEGPPSPLQFHTTASIDHCGATQGWQPPSGQDSISISCC
ncbi:maspardin [Striga asiatica]|uniref:Maspardin n=1 Tax=Striga asiatica TaxID=4170 RepID=A0A5A7Q8Q2_STRAF|nr:maspardin [Striga asiatica]